MPDARLISSKTLWHLHQVEGRDEAIGAWARANGIKTRDISVDHDIVIDGPPDARVIRYTAFARNERGSKYTLDGRNPVVEERTAPLVEYPPEGWPVYAVPGSPEEPTDG